jgi:hypothetical protein
VLDAAHEPGALDGRGGLRGEGAEHARGLVEALGECASSTSTVIAPSTPSALDTGAVSSRPCSAWRTDHALVGERVEPGGEEALLDGLEAARAWSPSPAAPASGA